MKREILKREGEIESEGEREYIEKKRGGKEEEKGGEIEEEMKM